MVIIGYIIHATISNCFPSIYTHAIPWALHGKEVVKNHRRITDYYGNLLDYCTQILRDGQTNGILIGPHSSNIISEIILTVIDEQLQKKGYNKFTRYIDDYEYYADTNEMAEKFLHDLGLFLREFELYLNVKKTKIIPLPTAWEENWRNELLRFTFPKNETIRFNIIRSFLDLATELAYKHSTSAIFNYALKMIPITINNRAKKMLVQEAINLALAYPYLAHYIEDVIFKKYNYEGIIKVINIFANNLIKLGIQKLLPDAIAHGIYYLIKYNGSLNKDEINYKDIITLNDCISIVLLFEYAKKNDCHAIKDDIIGHARALLSENKREQDKQWLLLYQIFSVEELKENNQEFLSHLKENNFEFIKNTNFSIP